MANSQANAPLSLSTRSTFWSWRRTTLCILVILFASCCYRLGFDFIQLSATADPWKMASDLLGAALSPAFNDQSPNLPDSAPHFLVRISTELLTTIRFAFIAMSMAFPIGITLGFLCSRYFPAHQLFKPISTFMRSIHELIWVMFFLAAIGDSPLAACAALAIPFAGSLAKVFSELLDETHSPARELLSYSGGGHIITFLTSTLPTAWPNILSYTLYRLECALRSSAVLGFIGYETIGLSIQRSSENLYFNELWTELYALIALIVLFDIWGAAVRRRLKTPPSERRPTNASTPITLLKKYQPRWRFLTVTFWLLIFGTILSWTIGTPLIQYHSHIPPNERIGTFFEQLIPAPVRETGSWAESTIWAADLWSKHGQEALITTLTLATTAILIAGAFALFILPLASRALAKANPLNVPSNATFLSTLIWRTIAFTTRTAFIISRAIPEYILAFLLISLMGPHAWPLVLAIAIHNFGILGRLWGEVVENDVSQAPTILRTCGANRSSIYLACHIPTIFSRLLLFLTYRWETCVREATVLGMLGISSLGYHIKLAESALHYDIMFFYVLLGTASIYIVDLFHSRLRSRLRV